MRTSSLLLLSPALAALLFSCGEPLPDGPCLCDVPTAQGNLGLSCGQTTCADGLSYFCAGHAAAPQVTGTCQSCQPKVCGGAGAACGSVADGCGGTLSCGGCGAGQACQAGACVPDACRQAGAVCGTVQGVACGQCPGTSTCASTGKACVEKVATLPFPYATSSALVGDTLYLAGPQVAGGSTYDLVALTLSTGQLRSLASGQAELSSLAVNGTHLFWASPSGMSKVAHGSATVETVPGFNEFCDSLVADSQRLFCGQGGSATYGVQFWGVKVMPTAGGPLSWLVHDLNYPHLALSSGMLFHLGTTDNYSSFSVLGVTRLSDNSSQSLVSGGALDSRFLLADAHAFYFSQRKGSAWAVTRAPFDNSAQVDVFTGSGFFPDSTALTGTEAWTSATIAGQLGLWKAALTGGAPTLVAKSADYGNSSYSADGLFHAGGKWVVAAGGSVYRLQVQE